jgi:hypothetical protein
MISFIASVAGARAGGAGLWYGGGRGSGGLAGVLGTLVWLFVIVLALFESSC